MWISMLAFSWSAGSFSDWHGSTDVLIHTYAARTIIVTTARRAALVTAVHVLSEPVAAFDSLS
jgi:hypothetical protein